MTINQIIVRAAETGGVEPEKETLLLAKVEHAVGEVQEGSTED